MVPWGHVQRRVCIRVEVFLLVGDAGGEAVVCPVKDLRFYPAHTSKVCVHGCVCGYVHLHVHIWMGFRVCAPVCGCVSIYVGGTV